MADVHNRTRYLAGCRCDRCKKAQSDYRKGLRQRKNGERVSPPAKPALTAVPPRAPDGDDQVGDSAPDRPRSVTDSVRDELEKLNSPAEKPGQAAVALAMARILDNELALPQHPAAAARLIDVLAALGRGGRSKRGKLAAVRDMTAGA